MTFQPRPATFQDVAAIYDLYREVARRSGGIARKEEEITMEYIEENLEKALATGFCFVIEHPENTAEVIAEIHCRPLGPRAFRHVLGELTIAIHPDFQGKGVGKTIFSQLLDVIRRTRPDIYRVELVTSEFNVGGQVLYQRLGFVVEGRMEGRIQTRHGMEADIPMAWFNPNYVENKQVDQ